MEAKTAKRPNRPKGIVEVVQFALGHWIRVHILIALNDGAHTAVQLADMFDVPLNNVSNHLRKMLDDGSIEVAKEERKGNVVQYWYRAVQIAYYSQAEAEAMPELQRQVIAGAIVQSGSAEVMAALYAGNLADPRTVLSWDWFHVDEQGREELEAETVRYLDRLSQIKVDATNRRAKSGEEATTMLVTLSAFERAPRTRS